MLSFGAVAALPTTPLANHRPGELLVKYREAGAAVPAKARLGLRAKRQLLGGRLELLELPAFLTEAGARAQLIEDPDVEFVEPNYLRYARVVTPDDPLFAVQYALRNTGQAGGVAGADLDLTAAWDADGDGTADRTGDGSVIVAVIDDAVATGHFDLAANMVGGFDFADNDTDPRPLSADDYHGTLVAGCIGAVGDNGLGVAGVAWNVKLMPLRTNLASGLDSATFVAAMEFARSNGARIVNASFGGPGFSQAELETIRSLGNSGVMLVVAAGNSDSNTDRALADYPSNYDSPNIVSVAATDRQDALTGFSQYGPVTVDVAAPGADVLTTALQNQFLQVSGTSFSAPLTAGVAALIAMHNDPQDVAEIKARLIEGAEAGNGIDRRVAGGRVNAARSLNLAPRPSLVLRSVQIEDADGNRALDPLETVTFVLTVENLWQDATGVTASLSSDSIDVVVASLPQSIAGIARGTAAVFRFDVGMADVAAHREAFLTLTLRAAGGYEAHRSFAVEVAELESGVAVEQVIQTDAYDEFHTWHLDLPSLPAGHDQLVFETTSPIDVDILVKRDVPANYFITLSVPPEGNQVFFADVPAALIGGSGGGNERVVIDDPQPGTYFVTVLNYDQVANNRYTLKAYTQAAPAPASPLPGGGGGGGGALGGVLLLALAGLARRLLRPCPPGY